VATRARVRAAGNMAIAPSGFRVRRAWLSGVSSGLKLDRRADTEIMLMSWGSEILSPNLNARHHESVDTWFIGKSQPCDFRRRGRHDGFHRR
jgi:hypothetical protein